MMQSFACYNYTAGTISVYYTHSIDNKALTFDIRVIGICLAKNPLKAEWQIFTQQYFFKCIGAILVPFT